MKMKFEGKIFTSEEKLDEAVMEAHPELLDDDFSDFIDSNVEDLE